MKGLVKVVFMGVALLLATNTSVVMASSYGFGCITSNEPGNCAAESAFSFTVEEVLMGQVTFTLFHENTMTDTGQVTEVYFDGSDNLGNYLSSNPEWNERVSPPSLPSEGNANPAFDTDFALDSDFQSGGQTNNVPLEAGGSLEIVFALVALTSFSDVVDAIEDGRLRLGLHVRSIELGGRDGSESFVSTVPVPAAVWLMGTGLIGLIGFRRKRPTK